MEKSIDPGQNDESLKVHERAQQFVLNQHGDLVSLLADKCVDIAGWDDRRGARLIIWPCTGGANQQWFARE